MNQDDDIGKCTHFILAQQPGNGNKNGIKRSVSKQRNNWFINANIPSVQVIKNIGEEL